MKYLLFILFLFLNSQANSILQVEDRLSFNTKKFPLKLDLKLANAYLSIGISIFATHELVGHYFFTSGAIRSYYSSKGYVNMAVGGVFKVSAIAALPMIIRGSEFKYKKKASITLLPVNILKNYYGFSFKYH